MQRKHQSTNRFWHNDRWIERNIEEREEFDYANYEPLDYFRGTHPQVMEKRIKEMNWQFTYDISQRQFEFKDRVKNFFESLIGWRPGEYRNYKRIL
jgi:hypothetical protein